VSAAKSAEELLAYLEADGILIKARRGPSGDLLGYAAGRPGDLNSKGEQIFHPGGRIAPDLTLPKLQARLEDVVPEEHPTARRNRPSTPWHEAADALDNFQSDLADDTHAQAHITALGELIEATSQKAPVNLRAELQAASKAFARAQWSQVRAEDRAAHALRRAARDIVHTATGPDGSALAALVAALVWAAMSPGAGTKQRTTPTRTRPPARPSRTSRRLPTWRSLRRLPNSQPARAGRKLAAFWPATYEQPSPTTPSGSSPTLPGRRSPPSSLMQKHVAIKPTSSSRRPLTTARQPARVLITRIQYTGRNPALNRRAEAARRLSTMAGSIPTQRRSNAQPATVTTTPAEQKHRQRR
jgi:hypothetical protein